MLCVVITSTDEINGLPKQGMYARYVKRVLDFILALMALVLFWWLLAIVAILVRMKLGSPVIFKQPRPGKDERVFTLYKFRSMTDERDENGELLPDEIRLTTFGKKLRSSSLDELPELFNILKGDMAIVGPRPLLTSYLCLYSPFQRLRHSVRPGLTGLAQVNGRNLIDWDDRFRLDVDYVRSCSFCLDVTIVLRTISSVIRKEGITASDAATMPPFQGSSK